MGVIIFVVRGKARRKIFCVMPRDAFHEPACNLQQLWQVFGSIEYWFADLRGARTLLLTRSSIIL